MNEEQRLKEAKELKNKEELRRKTFLKKICLFFPSSEASDHSAHEEDQDEVMSSQNPLSKICPTEG